MFSFDATTVAPKQGGIKHPIGNKFPFTITGTAMEENKEKNGKFLKVTFTSDAGSIENRYNVINNSETARKIAYEQLSALCHAVGIFRISENDQCAALRGGRGLMDVNWQAGHEPTAEKPEGGYVHVTKVYDLAGNEPGKGPAPSSSFAQPNQGQPQGNPPNGDFAPNGQQGQPPWGGNQQPQQTQQPQNQSNQGWSPGPNAGNANPPWKN